MLILYLVLHPTDQDASAPSLKPNDPSCRSLVMEGTWLRWILLRLDPSNFAESCEFGDRLERV